jgi:hypothetical protein
MECAVASAPVNRGVRKTLGVKLCASAYSVVVHARSVARVSDVEPTATGWLWISDGKVLNSCRSNRRDPVRRGEEYSRVFVSVAT